MHAQKILIAAGGTGGHIYPALAIADALCLAHPNLSVAFVGTPRGLENKILAGRGYPIFHLDIGRLNSNVSKRERLKTVLSLPKALWQSFRLLRRERPAFILGVGGHASGPLLLIASRLGIRTGIWEPNAIPGLANRWLSRFVDDCWAVFDEARRHLRNSNVFAAGMPIRREIEAVRELPPPVEDCDRKFRVLVFGGSQGARGLNNTIVEMIQSGDQWSRGFTFVHQTGPADFERVRDHYDAIFKKGSGARSGVVEVLAYLDDMDARYQWADLVICRSGTGTLSELAAIGKPSILIPLPNAADDHQRLNAESFAEGGASLIIPQRELTAAGLRASIERLRADPARLKSMGLAARMRHRSRAAEGMADEIWRRVEDNASR